MKLLPVSFVAFLGATLSVQAETPRVVADIAPVHSLVVQVMEGVGTPDLLMQPTVSPHGYALRPSEARALQNADLVFWVGHELTPQLEGVFESLAGDAHAVGLLDQKETVRYNFRSAEDYEISSEDDHGHGDHDDHADHDDHDDHDEHGHDDHDDHADHDDHDDHDEHGHDDHDDHADH
ncbi:MAG: metal ABC transporter solute-binding protein, Zn/Mn family, partial [Shimia sp.]|uniref:metal ABC transporter solute-binding protein, Zn/Mn family n=1 Tax=Shimia sp. TaxID=1954381 RepID=UPI0040585732